LLHCMSLLVAQSRHRDRVGECPLSGVKRTLVRIGTDAWAPLGYRRGESTRRM
jgi:hypothetical protein